VNNAAMLNSQILQTLPLEVRLALDALQTLHMRVKDEGVDFNAIALHTLISIEQFVSTARVTNS